MRSTTKAKIGIAGLGAIALSLAMTVPASADYEPGSGDVVAVGGDTPQFDLQFGADGDTSGDPGYNTAGNINKLITFNGTADGNARAAYANGSTEGAPIPLNPTVVLRAGTYPVQRVQSSGAAIAALLADTGTPETINFVFSASEPGSADQTAAQNAGWGYLHTVELGTDSVKIATDSTTNAPAGLSAAELLNIYDGTYKTWNAIPGNSGGSTDTIIPLLPPTSSSIYSTFNKALIAANGGNSFAYSTSVQTVEQNDPTAITGLSAAASADAIVPFSNARLNLWKSGYFHSPSVVFPGSPTALSPGIKVLTGTAPDTAASLSAAVVHYVIFRNSDASSTVPFQPGGTQNWVTTLFTNLGVSGAPKPFFDTTAGLADIAAAGTTPAYADLGDVSSGTG
jgi:ABC-type phosphate transport system substrate-binding protein